MPLRLLPRVPLAVCLGLCWSLTAFGQAPPSVKELSDFRTVETAISAKIGKANRTAALQPGYLGVHLTTNSQGQVVIEQLDADGPAAQLGLQPGDILTHAAGQELNDADSLRDILAQKSAGQPLRLTVLRQGAILEMTAMLTGASRPAQTAQPPVLGIELATPKEGDGVKVEKVASGSPAATAGIQAGDLLLSIDGTVLGQPGKLNGILAEKRPGEVVTLAVQRNDSILKVRATLAEAPAGTGRFGQRGSFDTRGGGFMVPWKKDVYRLAVIAIEYTDVKHNDKITPKDWEDSLFSKGTYTKKSVTGQTVHGSLNDYYHELSYNTFRVEGKVFPYVQVSKTRKDYDQSGPGRMSLLTEAMDKLLERDGTDALKDFDGIYFMYAGGRYQTVRGSLYWPHRSSVKHKGKNWPYFICPEGGSQMGNISVICHEFGHLLGLPDLYARPENPGSEGVGVWCAMSQQAGNGRPQHFSAWSKEQLGWLKPTVIDPTVPQKLILAPVQTSPRECFKVLAKADGSEYFLLENRLQKGFDASLPAQGLLIWRVVRNRPILEESHGVTGPAGPRVFPESVPFPSKSNDAFTPFTVPASRSQLPDGLTTHITNIRRLPDGRITFYVGYEYY
jgi:M6 family metalloprotease-like protein